ncbi:Putative stomatin/prohibitin-family membrane protease subunit aq_911 [hydrothermal vent metagenome]|uniref:Stomatin/prohibitin-family membrane protease subunit aq_911 n=1 Tax=hydrothermal vent metagenome TaxID=652676 RepID=A0A3B1DBA4_9ZZZZ
MSLSGIATVIIVIAVLLASALRVLNEYERAVVFRLGRLLAVKGPGLIILWPIIDKMTKISLRLVALDVPTQDIITKDNVSVKVNAVVYFRVVDAENAVIQVEDYFYATGQLSQTSLRAILGQVELDELLSEREKINHELQSLLDKRTDPWGIKVSNVEIKHVDLPSDMQRAMAKQAEAERERRAKVINALGEFQAAEKLAEAAEIIEKRPAALTLRYLQTIREMSSENSTNTIIPLPMDLIRPFLDALPKGKSQNT